MTLFSQNIKHYILLALKSSGVMVDGDIYAELDAAFNDLEGDLAHISRRVATLEDAGIVDYSDELITAIVDRDDE